MSNQSKRQWGLEESKKMYEKSFRELQVDYIDYLFGFFKTPAFRAQLGLAKTATINQITVKMLNAIQLPVPPKVIQSSFAERIAHITSQQNAIIESLNGIQHLFNSRMSLYFG